MHCLPIIGVLIRVCISNFIKDLVEYDTSMLSANEKYSVFSRPRYILITCRSEELHRCRTLNLINNTFIECVNKDGHPKFLHFPNSRIICANRYLDLVSVMANRCAPDTSSTEFSAIFFAHSNYDNTPMFVFGKGTTINPIDSCLILPLLQCIIYYWIS